MVPQRLDSLLKLKCTITKVLTEIFDWWNANKLTVNLNKTCYTIFKAPKKKKIPEFLNNVKINNVNIARVKSAKYLWVTLDENLNWKEHVRETNKAIIKTANAFKIVKHRLSQTTEPLLYHAYIYSKIQYGIEVYGKASATTITKVQTQQNRTLKILFSKDYYIPMQLLHKELKVLLIKDIYKLSIVKFLYKHQTYLLPEIFNDYFTQNHKIHKHNTRQSDVLHIKHTSNQKGKNTTKYQGAVLWNSLPKTLIQAETTKSFSKNLKKISIILLPKRNFCKLFIQLCSTFHIINISIFKNQLSENKQTV